LGILPNQEACKNIINKILKGAIGLTGSQEVRSSILLSSTLLTSCDFDDCKGFFIDTVISLLPEMPKTFISNSRRPTDALRQSGTRYAYIW